MAANDVQIRISAKDFASETLRGVSQTAQTTARSFNMLGSTAGNFAINTVSIMAGIAGFQGLTAAIQGTVNTVFNFTKSMETNEIGIAGILSSMTQVNGKNLEWNQALGISKHIMKQLSDEALRTNATTEELTTTFRALLGPGLGAGMKVDEIVKLSSVGATAVKSLGLNGTQLVQELRDLVQGGIQPASSTLATALGLKDKDIQAAKASSEGLFKFLMDRLAGFEMAGDASKKTMEGILDQIKEGVQRIGSQGTSPIYGAMKKELAEVANGLVFLNQETKQVELNPQLLNDLTYASNKAVEIGGNFMEMAKPIGEVAVPAMKLFGEAVVFAGENIKVIGSGLITWMAVGKISSIYKDMGAAASGATTSHTILGRAVAAVRTNYMMQAAEAKKTAAEEMRAAQQATATITAARNAKKMALKNEQIVTRAVQKAEQEGWVLVAMQIRELQAEYMRLGATAEQAGAMQLQAAKAAQGGQIILAQQIMATQRAHLGAAAAAEASAITAVSGAGRAASAVRTFTSAVWALAGGWFGVAAAIGYALYQLYEYQKNKNKIEAYNKNTEAIYKDGKYYKYVIEENPQVDQYAGGAPQGVMPSTRKVLREYTPDEYAAQYQKDEDEKQRKRIGSEEWLEEEEKKARELTNGLGSKFGTTGDDGKAAKAADKAAREAERARKEEASLKDKVADIIAGYDKKIQAENGTKFETETEKMNEEIANTRRELDKNKTAFEKYSIDVSKVEEKITEYQSMMNKKIAEEQARNIELLKIETENIKAMINDDFLAKAETEYRKAMIDIEKQKKEKYKESGSKEAADLWAKQKEEEAEHKKTQETRNGHLQRFNMELEHNDALIKLETKSKQEIDDLNRLELERKISYLNKELENAKLTKEKQVALEKEKVEALQKLEDIRSKNRLGGVSVAIIDIQNEQFNFAESYKSTWNDIDQSVNENFISILEGNKNLGEGIKGTILDLSKSIQDMFLNILYQGTVLQPLQNWFTGMLGNFGGGLVGYGSRPTGTQGPSFQNGGWFNKRAKGGYTKGWTLVGEEGPELMNFSMPGRVYNTKETKKMLQGNNEAPRPIINMNITTPNPESFRQSQGQMIAGFNRSLAAGRRNN